jgi:hypothetical protein
MTSHDDERKLREETAENDRRVREQGSTFLDHARSSADDEAGGRFAKANATTVVGSMPLPQYPRASTPFQSDPVGLEPPTGYRIDDLEHATMGSSFSPIAAQAGPTSAAPSHSVASDEPRGVGPSFNETPGGDGQNG